jgi:hypothetical protein
MWATKYILENQSKRSAASDAQRLEYWLKEFAAKHITEITMDMVKERTDTIAAVRTGATANGYV